MSPKKDLAGSRRQESRVGGRKVTTLSAEQLERKRANDREAQRTIRQRTKEHIEHLEQQVAELKARAEQFDEVVQRNAALEEEITRLRQQLAMVVGRQPYAEHPGEETYNRAPGRTVSTQYSDTLATHHPSREQSSVSSSSQASLAPSAERRYNPTRSQSLSQPTNMGYPNPNRVESYMFEGHHLQTPHMAEPAGAASGHMTVPANQLAFGTYGGGGSGSAGTQLAHPVESFPAAYQPTENPPQQGRPPPMILQDATGSQQVMPSYVSGGQRSISMPSIPTQSTSGGSYSVMQAQQVQHPGQYDYPWGDQT